MLNSRGNELVFSSRASKIENGYFSENETAELLLLFHASRVGPARCRRNTRVIPPEI